MTHLLTLGVLELIEDQNDDEAVSLYWLSRRVLVLAAHNTNDYNIESLVTLYGNIRDALEVLAEYENLEESPDDDLKHMVGFNYSERLADIEDVLQYLTDQGIHLQLH